MAGADWSHVVGAPNSVTVRSAPRLRTRLGVAVADQALSAGTNVLFMLIAARELDPKAFGVLSVLYVCWLITAGISRSVCGEPALVRIDTGPGWPRAVLASGALVAGACATLTAVVGSLAMPGHRSAVLLLAVLLPAMILQDLGRYVAFAQRRPAGALRLDVTWAVAQCALLVTFGVTGLLTLLTLLLSWAGAGALAGVHSLTLHARRVPRPSMRWVHESWTLGSRYLATFATSAGIALATGLCLGLIAGVEAVGALRGVQVDFGALNVLFAGVIAALVPEGARQDMASEVVRVRLFRVSAALVAIAVAATIVGVALPDRVGTAFLGDTWPAAQDLVLPVGIAATFGAALAGADVGLRSARAVRMSLGVHLRLAPLQLLLPIGGAFVADAAGYSWGLAIAMGAACVLWWRTFGRYRREGGA